MKQEIINRVEVLDTGELLLGLESNGEAMYQYVYREAAGVYWDSDKHGFKSTEMKEWSCAQWFGQIVGVVRTGLGVELTLGANVSWLNVPENQKAEILRENTIK
jgi:hypothetical protein